MSGEGWTRDDWDYVVPEEWEDLVSEDLCAAQPEHAEVAGPPVYCGLTDGHPGRCYNRELKWFFEGRK